MKCKHDGDAELASIHKDYAAGGSTPCDEVDWVAARNLVAKWEHWARERLLPTERSMGGAACTSLRGCPQPIYECCVAMPAAFPPV